MDTQKDNNKHFCQTPHIVPASSANFVIINRKLSKLTEQARLKPSGNEFSGDGYQNMEP
jgi:hypothetical protein